MDNGGRRGPAGGVGVMVGAMAGPRPPRVSGGCEHVMMNPPHQRQGPGRPPADAGKALAEGSVKAAVFITAASSGVAAPSKIAYKRCPSPCDFVPVSEPVCVQGDNLGVACFSHGDCNLAGYAGSGICSNTC